MVAGVAEQEENSPGSFQSRVIAPRTSSIWPIAESSRVGGTQIFTPPRVDSFFIESLPEISGTS